MRLPDSPTGEFGADEWTEVVMVVVMVVAVGVVVDKGADGWLVG